eukprot:TRINITY_DN4373_c0_g1_i1.p1 TRINITY_DN4373_c0_g1~~TRINITY_DN4373_c0_g1_i1.p1  ORF type:complete len:207 (-),score=64.48 TRINITY_DN4373_c0_g1_i1:63-683(-)
MLRFVLFALALVALAAAQSGASTAGVFPLFPENEFPLGNVVEVVFNFKNAGRGNLNVTYISAQLNSADAAAINLKNFTGFRYDSIVPPGYEVSFAYMFLPDESLSTGDYNFVGTAQYIDENGIPAESHFLNTKVTLLAPVTTFDAQTLSTYVMGLGIIAGIAFLVQTYVLGGKKQYGSAKPLSAGAVNDYVSDSNVSSWKNSKKRK